MGKNRNRLSIIAAVLEASRAGSSKTHIMFKANLSFKLLEKYLTVVTEIGFVQLRDSIYQITELGQNFLAQYKDFYEQYCRVQESFDALMIEQDRLEKICAKNPVFSPPRLVLDGEK